MIQWIIISVAFLFIVSNLLPFVRHSYWVVADEKEKGEANEKASESVIE